MFKDKNIRQKTRWYIHFLKPLEQHSTVEWRGLSGTHNWVPIISEISLYATRFSSHLMFRDGNLQDKKPVPCMHFDIFLFCHSRSPPYFYLPLGVFSFFLSIYVSAVKCNVQNISLHFVPASSQSTIVSEGFKGGTRGDPLVIVFNCVQNICYSLLNSSWGKITLAYAVVIDYYMR